MQFKVMFPGKLYDYSYLAVKAHVRRPGRWIPAGAMAGR